MWYWPYSEAYYGEFSEGEYYVIFIFIEHCGLDKERKVKKKKNEKQHERAENSTADISFIEKEVVTLKKRQASVEIILEKTMSNKWDFPADPVLTMKSTVIILSDQVLFERADLSLVISVTLFDVTHDGVLR